MHAGHLQDQLSFFAQRLLRVVLEEKPAGRRDLVGGCAPVRAASREARPHMYILGANGVMDDINPDAVKPYVDGVVATCEDFAALVRHMV